MNKEDHSYSKIDNNLGFFRYQKLGDIYLITNIVGDYSFLKPSEFRKFIKGTLNKKSKSYLMLKKKGFYKTPSSIKELITKYHQKHQFLLEGPSLHIIVVTLNCNYQCTYCQASSHYWHQKDDKKFDMDKATAKKVVDVIFHSPNNALTIEFQGGEPLVNWPVVKYIIDYAEKKNKKARKDLICTIVSNFSLMTDEIYDYCKKHMVSLCTSLDGPESIHNFNRPYPGGNSYQSTTHWIKKIKNYEKKQKNIYHSNALLTVSRKSLKYPKEIIDEYLKFGFTGIHIRPLSRLGFSSRNYDKIGYSAEEFLDFWKKTMDYIISLNKKHVFFYERGTAIILKKIFDQQDPNCLDLRSPCGAGIGQLLYNYNGKVFTCDEGRMIGDDTFVLGNVKKDNYTKLMSSDKLRAVCLSSVLENLQCDNCVYQPYCGVCPVSNYALYGNLFAPQINTYWCKLHKAMFDYVFEKLQDKKIYNIFQSWIGLKPAKNFKNIPANNHFEF